ncbi:hypothetical protein WN943_028107 [Citrus x changshan-huyou]
MMITFSAGYEHSRKLNFALNNFSGSPIPEFIGSLTKLSYLDLSFAEFEGPIPSHLGNLSALQHLDLSLNHLFSAGNLDWLWHLSSLTYLDLGSNNLSRSTDWFQVVGNLPLLTTLYLYRCHLPPIVPLSLLNLNYSTSLQFLELSENNLTNSIYPWLFNASSNLVLLGLDSNHLRGSIPVALKHIVSLSFLGLASNEFEGGVPDFFGNMCSLTMLNISDNKLRGHFPELIQNLCSGCTKNSLEILYLSSNEITGSVPDLGGFSSLKELYLENNRLNGFTNNSIGQMSKLRTLSLNGNSLIGVISEAFFSNLSSLTTLNLADNNLSLEFSNDWIPPFQLNFIHLRSCKMGPHFPKWLQTQNQVKELDISDAGISDTIPDWFWNQTNELFVLNISNNQIQGKLPDLSMRFDTSAMTQETSSNPTISMDYYFIVGGGTATAFSRYSSSYFDNVLLTWKGNKYRYKNTLGLVKILDLSNNKLGGAFPEEIMDLVGLVALNLSRNHLTGQISPKIGQLKSLDFLDLSKNLFFGGIPASLSQLSGLSVVDLSYNNLSGKIPLGTQLQSFNASHILYIRDISVIVSVIDRNLVILQP